MIAVKKFSSPVHISINTTAKCNLNCTHCSGDYGTRSKNELDRAGWIKIIEYLKYANVYTVNLTGGEPTQSPFLFDILEKLREYNIYVTLSSNLCFDDRTAQKLLGYNDIIRNLKTSIDGFDARSNGCIRKSKVINEAAIFDLITKNFEQFRARGMNMTIATVLHKALLKDLSQMIQFIEEIKPNNWVVSPLVSVGRAQKNAHLIMPDFCTLMEPNYEKIKERLASLGISFSQVDFPSISNSDPYGCPACNESVIINYDGRIAPCQLALEIMPKYGYDFPYIQENDYADIWHCESFARFRELQSCGCEDCGIHEKCKRCIPQSLRYFNDEYAPTPYCVSVADQIDLKNKNIWQKKLQQIEFGGEYGDNASFKKNKI